MLLGISVHENPRPPIQKIEHDDFCDNDVLNYAEMGIENVADFAKSLVKAPRIGQTALTDVSLPANVYPIENYRHGKPAA